MKEDEDSAFNFFCSDYENCSFLISKEPESTLVNVSFGCNYYEEIYAIAKDYFLKKYYSDYKIESKPIDLKYCITLTIDTSVLKSLKKAPKSADNE